MIYNEFKYQILWLSRDKGMEKKKVKEGGGK